MAKYFHISCGLRGCYMPDSSATVMVPTRRELKDYISSEAQSLDGDGWTVGLSKKNIATFAALCWREAQKAKPAFLPYALPYKERNQDHYPYGIFVSVASRADYLEYLKTLE